MTEEIIIDKEDKTKKYRNNEIDCLHFSCRKGESGKVLFWCDFYDDHCDNYTGCYYRKYLRLEQENEKLKKEVKQIGSDFIKKGDYARELEQENKELKKQIESDKGLITVGGKQQYKYLQRVDKLEQENKELKTKLDVFAFTISQYESALEEIREIAEDAKEGKYTTKSEDYTEGMHIIGCYVLNKINEVLNDK